MNSGKAKILTISGVKNSGKTTLIENLIPRLAAAGLRVAVIKHDGHSFAPDTPGTDSFRFFAAGAYGSAVFDSEKFFLTRRCPDSEEMLLEMFPDAELILLEGFKNSVYPKIRLVRQGLPEEAIGDPQTYLALVSDVALTASVPVLRPDDVEGIAQLVLGYAGAAGS